MSTNDVPGHKPENRDVLAMGSWAEHEDGSLIFVEAVEGGRVVYSMFDLDKEVEYRDAMPEAGFKEAFSWDPGEAEDKPRPVKKRWGKKPKDAPDDIPNVRWTWHDKTPMPWDRVFAKFDEGPRDLSADHTMTRAEAIARHLDLQGQKIRPREGDWLSKGQRAASEIMAGVGRAIGALRD